MTLGNTKYVGFYWTLPVKWAGFLEVPDDVDGAAAASKTIRYQRDRVRNWVKENNGDLIHESVFLEIEPDRATEAIQDPLNSAIELCQRRGATFAHVDFSEFHNARPHHFMMSHLRASNVPVLSLDPTPEFIGGEWFDPIEHFRDWRSAKKKWDARKQQMQPEIISRILDLKNASISWSGVAEWLNRNGYTTLNGKPWTGDNARKFLQAKIGNC